MATAARHDHEPMSAINITPMIDVMLVLIVMLILTIPVMTHSVAIDLPQPGPHSVDPTTPHRLEIDRTGALNWDGRTVGDAELKTLLESVGRDPARPVLHLRTDPEARYERFDAVLATIKRANITRLGFIGDSAFVSAIAR